MNTGSAARAQMWWMRAQGVNLWSSTARVVRGRLGGLSLEFRAELDGITIEGIDMIF